jgi:hypothetical protein
MTSIIHYSIAFLKDLKPIGIAFRNLKEATSATPGTVCKQISRTNLAKLVVP